MKVRKFFVLIAATALFANFFTGCSDKEQCKRIQTGPLDITIYPNATEYQELNVVNGYVHLTGRPPGKGIIVYRFSQDVFKAYERSCPHAPNDAEAIVTVDEESGMFAYDSICQTRFLLTDGYPFDGPTPCPLTEYRTSYDGSRLRIYY